MHLPRFSNLKLFKFTLFCFVCYNVWPMYGISVSHWHLENDKIVPLLTSPYYLKNSDDLIAFLNQSVYKKKLDELMKELVLIKSNLTGKMNKLDLFSNELPNRIGCIPDYFIDESDLYSVLNKNYFYRINYKEVITLNPGTNALPKCGEFMSLHMSMGTFDHLESMKKRNKLKMDPEENLGAKDLGISTTDFPHVLHTGLKSNPNSWKLYTLSSFYWRFKGNAREAIECARRAIYLAPRKYKDIPLLSLGTILQRANYINDSTIVISAAVDHAPQIPENLWSLGNSMMMLSQFNKSLELFHKVQKLVPELYTAKVEFIKKSINCFRDLKITLITMENSLDEILPGLEKYGALKKEFEEYHEKLEREQVPLKTRYADEPLEQKTSLMHRSNSAQICSTRFKDNEDTPILFCDFLSDIQIVMQDFALDILSNYIDLKRELIATYKINSLGIYKKIFVENYSEI